MAKKFTKYFSKFGLGQVGESLEITESMRNTLGGKGAGLAVMSNMGFNIPQVLPFLQRFLKFSHLFLVIALMML